MSEFVNKKDNLFWRFFLKGFIHTEHSKCNIFSADRKHVFWVHTCSDTIDDQDGVQGNQSENDSLFSKFDHRNDKTSPAI